MTKKTNGTIHTIIGKQINFSDYRNSKEVVKVLTENNHSKFTFLDNNRNIDDKHVEALATSIRKNGQFSPIIVNEKLEVIDGQHRLKALMLLNYPVAYIINETATSKDIAVINNSQKGWKNRDYLKHFSHNSHYNHSEYRKIEKFFEEHGLPFRVGLTLLYDSSAVAIGPGAKDRGPYPDFRKGTFKIKDLGQAEEIAKQLLKLKSFVPHLVTIIKFCIAFLKVSKLDNFDINLAYKQIEKNSNRFDKCYNQEDWNEAMVAVYNFKLQTKGKRGYKRISIRKDGF